jgi:DnaK suppressor protein
MTMRNMTGAVDAWPWDREAPERLRARLVELKRTLLDSARRSFSDQPSVDPDDMPDAMDVAASEHSQFVVFSRHEREGALLQKVEAALQRIANGSFGECDRCGQDIPPARLEAVPVTTLCLDCQDEEEMALRRYAFGRRTT